MRFMFKKLFGFIGREKRVAQKMYALGRCTELMKGQIKDDFAWEVTESMKLIRKNKLLEEIADFYLMKVPKALE